MIKIPSSCFNVSIAGLAVTIIILVGCDTAFGQNSDTRGKINPYSPSPSPRVKSNEPSSVIVSTKSGPSDVSFVVQAKGSSVQESRPTIAEKTSNFARNAELKSKPLTEIYKIGIGDVLFVNLKNAAQGSGYYTVRIDGTIDFPLAGDNVHVADQTVDTAAEILKSGITLFSSPQVEVKVRQYASHRIVISGLVENAGEKNLQREAMPLFAISSEAGVSATASRALITRATGQKVEIHDLRDLKSGDILIYPGNIVEFAGDSGAGTFVGGSYFIAGEVVSTGQKELTHGLTLYQAVIASGGAKGDPKKAILRRKNEKGLLANVGYNLRSIKNGKFMDPVLADGDIIEIHN